MKDLSFKRNSQKYFESLKTIFSRISYHGYRRIVLIQGKMDQDLYLSILKDHMSFP